VRWFLGVCLHAGTVVGWWHDVACELRDEMNLCEVGGAVARVRGVVNALWASVYSSEFSRTRQFAIDVCIRLSLGIICRRVYAIHCLPSTLSASPCHPSSF
jgi:hypothetical protein